MIRNKIATFIGLKFQDVITGTEIVPVLEFLKKSQFWDEQKSNQYRLEKLKLITEYAYRNVPYYTKLFNRIKLSPEDIKSLEDIEKIPILTKEIMRKEHADLISRVYNKKRIKTGKTGGTTGVPLVTYKDTFDRTYTWAPYYRWYNWMSLEVGDRTITFWGANTVLSDSLITKYKGLFLDFLHNSNTINSFEMKESTLPGIIDLLNKTRPKLIKGYLSSLLFLADYLYRNKIKLEFIPLALSTTSETLLPHHRIFLKNVFHADVFDQYGCGEVSSIAFECAKHKGLHINNEHVIVEVIDENDQHITDKSGRIIVTNLDNLVMPYLRYENGDIGQLMSEKCTCGVVHPLMKSIDGRATDALYLKGGENVHGVFITDIFYELGITTDALSLFQVYQNEVGKIELRFEKKSNIDKSLLIKLEDALKKFFSEVKISFMDELQYEKNGKFKYIISEVSEN